MRIYAFVGPSGSGKTRLIQQLVPELKARGRSVGVIKHCAGGFSLDVEGKDSWLFTQAGADYVAVRSAQQVAVFLNAASELDAHTLALSRFPHVDIVLVEGAKEDRTLPKVEVVPQGTQQRLGLPPEEIVAVVADRELTGDRPVYSPHQVSQLADLLDNGSQETEPGMHLSVDGKAVPLNPFVRNIFHNVVLGMVASLKGVVRSPRHVALTVEGKEAPNERC